MLSKKEERSRRVKERSLTRPFSQRHNQKRHSDQGPRNWLETGFECFFGYRYYDSNKSQACSRKSRYLAKYWTVRVRLFKDKYLEIAERSKVSPPQLIAPTRSIFSKATVCWFLESTACP
jgi:hypothetical protein